MKNKLLISSLIAIGFIFMSFRAENNKYFEITKNLEIFSNLYKELNTHYVDELDPGKLMKVGIDAIMQSLDPYTVYWSGTQIEGYKYQQKGTYKGMGANFEKVGDYITVTGIYEGKSAQEAGLIVGDQIHTINDIDIVGKAMSEVEPFMLGTPGTSMKLGVQHPGNTEIETIEVLRSSINQTNVPHFQILDGDIAYVNLSTFTQLASKNIQGALRKLKSEQKDIKGVVLDLRNNGGGLLLEAINVSNLFIPKDEVVVSTRGKVPERDRSYRTRQEPYDEDVPLTVLINKSSASASEIVAGVIQDFDRGVLVGQRSYGKGLVQNTKELGYNARTKITTSKYYIPSDRCIQSAEYENGEPKDIPDDLRATFYTKGGRPVKDGGGISPDVLIEKTEDSELILALKEQHVFFNYATQYLLDPTITIDSMGYRFEQLDDFISYVEESGFSFKSSVEQNIDALSQNVEKAKLSADVSALVDQIRASIQQDVRTAIQNEQTEVISYLEEELIGRRHYEKGKITYHLDRDPEVSKAIEILRDKEQYNNILKK